MNVATFKQLVKGNFFSIQFVKKDGTLRTMNARLGVKPKLASTDPKHINAAKRRKVTLENNGMVQCTDMQVYLRNYRQKKQEFIEEGLSKAKATELAKEYANASSYRTANIEEALSLKFNGCHYIKIGDSWKLVS